jgi:hypothetical protein
MWSVEQKARVLAEGSHLSGEQLKRGERRQEPDAHGAAGGELDRRNPPLIEARCRNAEP